MKHGHAVPGSVHLCMRDLVHASVRACVGPCICACVHVGFLPRFAALPEYLQACMSSRACVLCTFQDDVTAGVVGGLPPKYEGSM